MAAAVGGLELAREAVVHAGWYLRYRVNGTTHEGEDPADDETPGAGPGATSG